MILGFSTLSESGRRKDRTVKPQPGKRSDCDAHHHHSHPCLPTCNLCLGKPIARNTAKLVLTNATDFLQHRCCTLPGFGWLQFRDELLASCHDAVVTGHDSVDLRDSTRCLDGIQDCDNFSQKRGGEGQLD